MPGYCYLTLGWDISIPHLPLLCLRQCYPTLPNYFIMTTTKKFSSINYPKLPQYVLITPKYKRTHLVQYVSVVTASNDTLTFYFRFEIPNIYYFQNIRVQHTVTLTLPHCACKLSRASFTDYSKATRVIKFYMAYTGVVETNYHTQEQKIHLGFVIKLSPVLYVILTWSSIGFILQLFHITILQMQQVFCKLYQH